MPPAEGEHAEPGEEVEVRVALAVEEIRTFGSDPLAIEAERAEHARHLRIDVALVQRERLMAALGEQCGEIEAAAARRRARSARRVRRAR